jgi:phosphatidylglycerophosphate synthase
MSSDTGIVLVSQEEWSVAVAGLPLLHRIVLSGHRAGLKHWLVLAWKEAEQVRTSLMASVKLQDIDWRIYDLQDMRPARLEMVLPMEEVVVVACLAVFDHASLSELLTTEGAGLCVTSTPTELGVPLARQDGRASTMSATAAPDCYATGLLRCSGVHLARVMRQSWETMPHASFRLTALVSSLLALPSVHTVDISQHLWMPLSTPIDTTVATAETQLLRRLGRQRESPVIRYISRPLSRLLTRRLMRTAITPNQITFASALLGLSGACLLAQPGYVWQVLGSLLFLLSTIIDGCDGEIARLTFQESAFGAKLDIIMDNVVHLFLFPGMALGLYRQQHDPFYLILGAVALVGVLLSMVVYMPSRLHPRQNRSAQTRLHDSLASRDFAYLLPILVLCQRLHWFLWATAIGTYVFAIAWAVMAQYERWCQRRYTTS